MNESNCKDNGVKGQSRPQSFGLIWQNRQNPFFSWPNTSWLLDVVMKFYPRTVFRRKAECIDFYLHHWCLFIFKVDLGFQIWLNHYREKWSIFTSFWELFWTQLRFIKRGLDLFKICSSSVKFWGTLSLLLRFGLMFSYQRMVGLKSQFLLLHLARLFYLIKTSNFLQ